MAINEALYERIAKGPIDARLRTDILDEILRCVESRKNDLGIWEKELFAQSLACLATNVACPTQPTELWLRLSLVSLDKAMVPKQERNESYTVASDDVDCVDYHFLVKEAEKIRLRVHD